jgi:formylglycine-generating enzyme required for sulfatase activity
LVRVASLPGLSEEITRVVYLLKPLTAEHVREAIIGPARAKGVEFESHELVEGLVKSTVGAEGALPLLQFALAELWEARDAVRNLISGSALEASGGVTGALARHADRVLASLQPEQRSAARRLLLLLVTLEGTRARQTEQELGAENLTDRRALAALVRGRLLTATDSPEGSAYEVAHEALINSWPTLRRWLDEDAERRILRDRLSTAISEWERLGRKREALWSARQLAEVTLLEDSQLLPREKVFLEASHRAVRFKRRLSLAIVSALVLALAGTYFGVQLKARRDLSAQVQALVSEGAATLAKARAANERVEELRTQAFSLFDNKQIEGGEEVWDRVRVLSAQADALRAEAGRSLEAAVALGKESPTARALLADVLYERALQADRDGRAIQRDELIARLPLYDDGTRKAKWTAPAQLSLSTAPAAAQVTIQHYRERESKNPELENWGSTLSTPLQLELPPGSYLVAVAAPGVISVRIPILPRRGEQLKFSLGLPSPRSIPGGFIYIPAGPFLFGSSADRSLRRDYFHTVPLHEVTTGAYLIAQHETTFAEWMMYLEALPASERIKRVPSVGAAMFGAVALKPVGPSWQLTFRLQSQNHIMGVGDAFEIQEREKRKSQNWLRLPVVGISAVEALNYLNWLSSSGTVPRARLCTEHEWEKAARGADGREYPHGDYLFPDDANFDQTYGKKTSTLGPDEVGSHPLSRSPFGVDDMSGNVWELTRSSLQKDEYIARGGAFFFSPNNARTSNREVATPTYRDTTLGLRVCADLP